MKLPKKLLYLFAEYQLSDFSECEFKPDFIGGNPSFKTYLRWRFGENWIFNIDREGLTQRQYALVVKQFEIIIQKRNHLFRNEFYEI
jgi:hypothetical protein